ncbi:hypothetical protein SUGI_0979130 [Cryptomeria japonica]|nr:hypothetical protein SUGI_0979130 [Cryptomeria japonica]
MVSKVDSPKGIAAEGKHYYNIWQNIFEIDTKYVPIKPIGKGAYGIVCSAQNKETNEKIAIKKIINVFENRTDAQRTLREIRLLRQIRSLGLLNRSRMTIANISSTSCLEA